MELPRPRHSYATLVTIALLACLAVAIAEPSWSAPSYTIRDIGLADAEHTRVDGYRYGEATQLNGFGQVVGTSQRFSGSGADLGQSAWLYDGTTTVRLGLMDAEHVRSDGYAFTGAGLLSESGQVIGFSLRYNSGNADLGRSAWLYDGKTMVKLGLTDAEHTRSDGYKDTSYSLDLLDNPLSDIGQVVGYSQRYNSGSAYLGQSAWLYDGTTTVKLGLTDAEHTRSDGFKRSDITDSAKSGQITGYSDGYNGGSSVLGTSAWLYDGTTTVRLGLTDAEHTRVDGLQSNKAQAVNESGHVIGTSQRYNGSGADLGQSAWLYDGTTTVKLGLMDAEHVRSDGYAFNGGNLLNESDYVVGSALRYSDGFFYKGVSAWLYDGATTVEIGLTDAEHTAGGRRENYGLQLNQIGQVVGRSNRFTSGGTSLGQSAWLYDGTTTVKLGLTDAEHTAYDGFRENINVELNEAGQVLGYSTRYNGGFHDSLFGPGRSVWLYNGSSTLNIGLADAEHTDNFGNKYSDAYELNEAGQVIGGSWRYSGDGEIVWQDAWVYDPVLGTIPLRPSQSEDDYGGSDADFLGEDGVVLGSYSMYDSDLGDYAQFAFYWTREDGFLDLGRLVADGLDENGWAALHLSIQANGVGQIVGSGVAAGLPEGSQSAFLLTSQTAIPEPSCVSYAVIGAFAGAFLGRTAHRRAGATSRRKC